MRQLDELSILWVKYVDTSTICPNPNVSVSFCHTKHYIAADSRIVRLERRKLFAAVERGRYTFSCLQIESDNARPSTTAYQNISFVDTDIGNTEVFVYRE